MRPVVSRYACYLYIQFNAVFFYLLMFGLFAYQICKYLFRCSVLCCVSVHLMYDTHLYYFTVLYFSQHQLLRILWMRFATC